MPMFASAEAHTSGAILPVSAALRRPVTSSSCVSVPTSKNRSISASSASATISMSASRAAVAASAMSAGTSPSDGFPLPSVA